MHLFIPLPLPVMAVAGRCDRDVPLHLDGLDSLSGHRISRTSHVSPASTLSIAKSTVSATPTVPARGTFIRAIARDNVADHHSFVEYETAADLASAVEKLDNHTFKDSTVRCISDVKSYPYLIDLKGTDGYKPQADIPRPRERYRSRSPGYRGGRGYGPPPDDYYDRRGPPRGYSPRRDDYRRRTPPPRGYYDDPRDDRFGPPRGRPPMDDYPPPPRGRYADDRYGAPPPPPRGYGEPEAYMNGHGREPYARPPLSPRRDGRAYDREPYAGRPYW